MSSGAIMKSSNEVLAVLRSIYTELGYEADNLLKYEEIELVGHIQRKDGKILKIVRQHIDDLMCAQDKKARSIIKFALSSFQDVLQ
jgi:hypothetical protein